MSTPLSPNNLFDVNGLVAVITGGGTGRYGYDLTRSSFVYWVTRNWPDDGQSTRRKRGDSIHSGATLGDTNKSGRGKQRENAIITIRSSLLTYLVSVMEKSSHSREMSRLRNL